MTAPDPQQAQRNRRLLLLFIAFFVVSSIGVTIYGFYVVDRVKTEAKRSDVALRLRAWSILAEANATGSFPSKEEQVDPRLDQSDLGGGQLHALAILSRGVSSKDNSLAGWGYPVTRIEALEGSMADRFEMNPEVVGEIVEVSWDPEGRLPPVLSVSGRPSGLVAGGTTLELVNSWLRRAGEGLVNRFVPGKTAIPNAPDRR